MRQIILCRHTETELIASGSKSHRRNDSSLTKYGVEQAEEIKKFIDDNGYKFEVVFTSLYQRAKTTAEVLSTETGKKIVMSGAFAEYFMRDDDKGVESIDMAVARTMTKIYSIFDQYEDILLVGHSSINKSIIQNILNLPFDESLELYNKLGETHVLRYDWKQGDNNWRVVDSFIPKQPANLKVK
jgi:broad specificity phosphatase PhoE